MDFIPAIDLKGGSCVRLRQGRMDDATVFSDDPIKVAKAFQSQGAQRLHIVDLDGAGTGAPVHFEIIAKVIEAASDMAVQIGGGLREHEHLERYMDAGAKRLVLGTKAVMDPEFLRQSARRWPEQILLGLDVRDGKIAIEGWAKSFDMTERELVLQSKDLPLGGIVFTDVSKDGMLEGVSIAKTLALAKNIPFPLIASGGISDYEDLKLLVDAAQNEGIELDGVISGRALYEGKLDCAQAVLLCQQASSR